MKQTIETSKQFDLTTHLRDGKGNIAKENHYELTIKDGVKEFERPPKSGIFYDEAGNITRREKVEKAPEPLSAVQALEFQNDALKKQLAELQAKMSAAPSDPDTGTTSDMPKTDEHTQEVKPAQARRGVNLNI